MNKEIEVCALCGTPDQDKATDHLRECYKKNQGTLDRSMFKPILSYEERSRLQKGFNPICSNLKKCRKRRNW